MSLSFLLGKTALVDQELDSLFAKNTDKATESTPRVSKKGKGKEKDVEHTKPSEEKKAKKSKKRKAGEDHEDESHQPSNAGSSSSSPDSTIKRKRAHVEHKDGKKKEKKQKRAEAELTEETVNTGTPTESSASSLKPNKKKHHKKSAVEVQDGDGDGDAQEAQLITINQHQASEAEDYDAAQNYVPPVHESITSPAKLLPPSKKKQLYVPASETSSQRDSRTIFIGNLPVVVAQKRPMLKSLHRHILSLVPGAKIESSRVRSVAFQTPTSKLPDDAEDAASKGKKGDTSSSGRTHDKERTQAWRQQQDAVEAGEEKERKQYLTTSQKKRIAFIHQDFHPEADRVNVYMVFAHPRPSVSPATPAEENESDDDADADDDNDAGAMKVDKASPAPLSPYEAASLAKQNCDGTTFMERILRVDVVGPILSFNGDASGPPASASTAQSDPKRSVFVGNLDFATKEDDLRAFMEALVRGELGEAPEDSDATPGKVGSWVERVRLVRDRETSLGKGFGYVQFCARECVDEVLTVDQAKLKFAKRTLRVQRCKTVPGGSSHKISSAAATNGTPYRPTTSPHRPPRGVAVDVPRGDPALGEKLAGLSKDERKAAKHADADRVQRRLAKKKARNAMSVSTTSGGKERVRVRKDAKPVGGGKASQ